MSLLDFSPLIPLGTFSILLTTISSDAHPRPYGILGKVSIGDKLDACKCMDRVIKHNVTNLKTLILPSRDD